MCPIEQSKDSPYNDEFITETGSMNDLYMEAQATLVENTPTNYYSNSIHLIQFPNVSQNAADKISP